MPPSPSPTPVVAIVVTYDGAELLPRCLGALSAIPAIGSILVVDNASVDNSAALAAQYPRTTVIALPRNLGFGQANNAALRRLLPAPPEFVLLINQDAWLTADCLDSLVRIARANPACGIVSPVHHLADGVTVEPVFARHLASAGMTADFLSGRAAQETYRVEFVNAALWLVRGELLPRLGGFDPLFPHYGEDFEYCERVRAHGLHVAVAPAARAVHARIGTAGNRPFSRSAYVRRLSGRQRADALAVLRAQGNCFATRVLHWLAHVAERTEQAIADRKLTHLEALARASIHVAALLPLVWWRRRLVRRRHSHFLENAPSF